MSKKLYDYDACYKIAKQCSCSSDMQKKNGSAYNVARKFNWIRDYTWFVRKQHTPYTYEEVYRIAKNYTCSSDFQKGNGSAYGKARANGWIKDYTWFTVKQHSPYTYEQCYATARNYKSRVKLARGNVGVYQAALNHGWLDDYTWFDSGQKPYNYWTKERVIAESKKYKNRGEFHDNNGTAYSKARTNGWLDEFTWLKDDRIDFSKDKIDCVYAYEFVDLKAVYVGRTLVRRVEERDKEHLFTDTDAVCLFAKENNIPVPDMIILESDLTLADGIKKEGEYLEDYRKKGWRILNRAKTGGIGLIARNKWSKNTCYQEALKYKTRGAFAKKSSRAYEVARQNGWLDNYSWFDEKQKPTGYWNDYTTCSNAALECKSRAEFIKKYPAGYRNAKTNGWLNDYTWLSHRKRWNYTSVLEEAHKHHTKKALKDNAPGAYRAALQNGWLDMFDWFEDTHSVLSKAVKASKKPKWTYEKCRQIASQSNGRDDFRKKASGAYSAAWKNKWLDDFFPKKAQKE